MDRKPYHNLIVWKEAHQFVLDAYKLTECFPGEEKYALTNQLRRAAVSVPTNVVEGYAKRSRKELLHYLDISLGSLTECEYLLELARDLKYLKLEEYKSLESQRARVGFLLMKFTKSKSV